MKPTKTKAAPPTKECAASENLQHADDSKPTKWRTTVGHLLRGPRHRFDGERWGDHALHSTVASLQRFHGLEIDRAWMEVPNRFGTRTRVKAYWVADNCRRTAYALIGKKCRKGGSDA